MARKPGLSASRPARAGAEGPVNRGARHGTAWDAPTPSRYRTASARRLYRRWRPAPESTEERHFALIERVGISATAKAKLVHGQGDEPLLGTRITLGDPTQNAGVVRVRRVNPYRP